MISKEEGYFNVLTDGATQLSCMLCWSS